MNAKRSASFEASQAMAKTKIMQDARLDKIKISSTEESKQAANNSAIFKVVTQPLKDNEVDEQLYINDFEEFSKSDKYKEVFNSIIDSAITPKREETEQFDAELKEKGENTMFESISKIDKTKALKAILKKTKLSDLSGEIMKIAGFAKAIPFLDIKEKKDSAMIFLIGLDYLVKGLFTHWQITLMEESEKTKNTLLRQKMKEEVILMNHDMKYNILIGDQFHAKAYYLITRLGNNDLSKILTIIEENFAKIIFRDGYNGNKTHNLKKLYKDFYNYLPTFFGHGFKGIAIICEMGNSSIDKSFTLGIEYGF
jgi:hypothetical protein